MKPGFSVHSAAAAVLAAASALAASTVGRAGAENPWHLLAEFSAFNPTPRTRIAEPVVIALADIAGGQVWPRGAALELADGRGSVPSQVDDLDGDGNPDEIACLLDFAPGEKKRLILRLGTAAGAPTSPIAPRVHAQLALRGGGIWISRTVLSAPNGNLYNETVHHGPAWESELIGYRMYFDGRSAIDVYGKHVHRLELARTRWGTSAALIREGYGGDILLVDENIGAGSLRGWSGGRATEIAPVLRRTARIRARGPLRTIVEMDAEEWEFRPGETARLTSRMILYAGHRDMRYEAALAPGSAELPELCTGLPRIEGARWRTGEPHTLAFWGTAHPRKSKAFAPETVGLAVIVPPAQAAGLAADELNRLILLKPDRTQPLGYHITAAWARENDGPTTAGKFFAHVDELTANLGAPIILRRQR